MLKLAKQKGTIRSVGAIVVVNGRPVKFESFSVEQSGFSAADSFEVSLPFFIDDPEDKREVLYNGPSFKTVLLEKSSLPVQIYVGYVNNLREYSKKDLVQLIDGTMDTADWEFDSSGERVTIHGRNVVGKLLDAKINEKIPNLTASQIAIKYAKEYGLTPQVTKTTTLAGKYFNKEGSTIGRETSKWDLLLYLAEQENFIVRVKGKTLYFGPYSEVTAYENVKDAVSYTWGRNIESLRFERSPQAARDIVVKVKSFNRNTKKPVLGEAHSTTQRSKKIKGQEGKREEHVVTMTMPGLSQEQANRKAQSVLRELSERQVTGTMSCAGNTDLSVDRRITLYGVGKGFSVPFYINKVTHAFSMSDGFKSEVSFSSRFFGGDENG